MSDNLTAKFTTLESQISANHTELMDALNTIAFALGAPPSAPTITLADVVEALNVGNLLLATGNTTSAAILADMNIGLGSINQLLDTLNSNGSTNAQLLYSAILQTACKCDTDAPLLAPPLIIDPTPLAEDEKCARIQFFLSIFGAMVDNIANFGGAGATITGATLGELLFAAITAATAEGAVLGALAGPPGIVVGAIVGIIAAIVGTLGAAYLFQLSQQWHQDPLPAQLLAAMYAADTAEEGYNAFASVIDASNVLNLPFKPLILALAWSGFFNDVYSDTPELDTSGFDSTICAPDDSEIVMVVPTVGCRSAQSVLGTMGDSTTLQTIDWSPGSTSNMVDVSLTQTSDKRVWGLTDLFGLWVYSVPDCHAYLDATGFPNMAITSTPQQIPVHTNNRYSFVTGSTPFVLVICVDEPEV